MPETFFASDHHLQHAKFLTFKDKNDMFIRPEFDDIQDHDEYIVKAHNETVSDKDTVYFLGDVLWRYDTQGFDYLRAMKGHKRLLIGNHDKGMLLVPYFERLELWRKFEVGNFRFIMSHVPLAGDDMKRLGYNMHGHIHEKLVRDNSGQPDSRYMNVCMEQIGYTPVSLEEVIGLWQ